MYQALISNSDYCLQDAQFLLKGAGGRMTIQDMIIKERPVLSAFEVTPTSDQVSFFFFFLEEVIEPSSLIRVLEKWGSKRHNLFPYYLLRPGSVSWLHLIHIFALSIFLPIIF